MAEEDNVDLFGQDNHAYLAKNASFHKTKGALEELFAEEDGHDIPNDDEIVVLLLLQVCVSRGLCISCDLICSQSTLQKAR